MTATRGLCQVCHRDYALVPSTGMVRSHATRWPVQGNRCAGSYHLPKHALRTTNREDSTMPNNAVNHRPEDTDYAADVAPSQAPPPMDQAMALLQQQWVQETAWVLERALPYVKTDALRAVAVDVVAKLTGSLGNGLSNVPVE